MTASPRRLLVGVTGATGAMVTRSFLRQRPDETEIHLICSRWGRHVYQHELGEDPHAWADHGIRVHPDSDLSDPLASGSNAWDAMVILPCSSTTAAKVALGLGETLLTRTAVVTLKERRRLLVGFRETPVTAAMLGHLTDLDRMGAVVVPLMPAFYLRPDTIEAAADQLAARFWGLLGVERGERWRDGELDTDS